MHDAQQNRPAPATTAMPRRRKRWLFATGAMFVGFLPLVIVEIVLRCCGVGLITDSQDPYVGFVNIRPLFKANRETGRYEIAPERLTFFRPESFSIQKAPNEFRIFCLGGSTVQGRPYAIETSFTTWLELNLQTADSTRHWEVVNCGGVSYASYRLVPILQELLNYEPDLFIICTGHNEFLEDRTYGPVKKMPHWLVQCHVWLSRLHTYNALRNMALRVRRGADQADGDQRSVLPEEVNALLDYRGGLDDYHRDASWRAGTIAHFEYNLHRMVAMAHEHGVPVVLINPPYNLKNSPPFKFANGNGLTDDALERFNHLWDKAKQEGITTAERIGLLQRAIDIDTQHAGIHYHLGKCYYNQKQLDLAKVEFIAAKDEDICPLRILTPMREAVFEVAHDHSTQLVDAQRLFEQLTRDGITGSEWFVDHVHPTIRGHQQLASALFNAMVRQGWVHPTDDWKSRRDATFHAHWQSLDAMYYIRGQQRLEGLRRWSQGRANLIKPSTKPPTAGDSAKTTD